MIDPKDKKPELDWTDDEFYEGAWSWVDECEVEQLEELLKQDNVETTIKRTKKDDKY